MKGFWLPRPVLITRAAAAFQRNNIVQSLPLDEFVSLIGSIRTWLFQGCVGSLLLIQSGSITSGGKGMTRQKPLQVQPRHMLYPPITQENAHMSVKIHTWRTVHLSYVDSHPSCSRLAVKAEALYTPTPQILL